LEKLVALAESLEVEGVAYTKSYHAIERELLLRSTVHVYPVS
jgi:hypothetical protein